MREVPTLLKVLRNIHRWPKPQSQQFLWVFWVRFFFLIKRKAKKRLLCIFIVELETFRGGGWSLLFKESIKIS